MNVATPSVEVTGDDGSVRLAGEWTLAGLQGRLPSLRQRLTRASAGARTWDLSGVQRLDTLGASVLWRTWGERLPETLIADEALRGMFAAVSVLGPRPPAAPDRASIPGRIAGLGRRGLGALSQMLGVVGVLGQAALDLVHLARRPQDAPLRELSANLYKTGVSALPITALVGFLIGIVLSYLSALQLKNFGADVFIIDILGIGITRELGPVLVAVLVAGRSGSAMTAQLGVMRVTEEIDALATMGVPAGLRLVLPKVLALLITMPLLVAWTSSAAIAGGMVAAAFQLDMSFGFFLDTLPRVVPLANAWIGLAKGLAFGMTIALVACHFGLNVKPNTESLSENTTRSVVSAITLVILVDAVFAIATRNMGMPG
ncbi:ABC transporter permease [Methyloversatilis thermotolerans]|uniref:ABC transporter permease n=1 Tax=Methyloversatilis thermotolerans TaxID=1346290 RepID=UPI000367DCDB|nr:ABC transporter permease [Methyloversatilis thermotolerans]